MYLRLPMRNPGNKERAPVLVWQPRRDALSSDRHDAPTQKPSLHVPTHRNNLQIKTNRNRVNRTTVCNQTDERTHEHRKLKARMPIETDQFTITYMYIICTCNKISHGSPDNSLRVLTDLTHYKNMKQQKTCTPKDGTFHIPPYFVLTKKT